MRCLIFVIISVVEADTRKKKRAQALAALGTRKSPWSHPVKVFYGESTASEDETKGKQKARPKVAYPRKRKVGYVA